MASAIDLVVDTSAVVAILTGEPDAVELLARLKSSRFPGICAATRTELLLVMHGRYGEAGVARAKQFLAREQITAIALDKNLADTALLGYQHFGKGQHPAGLNFGDCFS